MSKLETVELDGSFGEGGGQILRTSLALSLLIRKPFHLRNVRAGRPRPGLQPQHLMSVRAAATISQAQVRGASMGSTDLEFHPGSAVPGTYHFAIGTAGATGLVLHTICLPLALTHSPSQVTIDGGTHVSASPCFHFLEATWRAYMELLRLRIGLKMRRPGFYPRGGGLLQANLAPCPAVQGLNDFQLVPATALRGVSAVAGLPEHIARRQAHRAAQRLRKSGLRVDIEEQSWPGGPGTVLVLTLNTSPVPTTFFALGERGKPAERVADEAVAQVTRFQDTAPSAIDQYSADQLLLPLALADGPSTFPVAEVTQHLLTNAFVIGRFVARDTHIEGSEGRPGTVRIPGRGQLAT
jgi:RNA 3'-terminal phosphate cyclase (ATP)